MDEMVSATTVHLGFDPGPVAELFIGLPGPEIAGGRELKGRPPLGRTSSFPEGTPLGLALDEGGPVTGLLDPETLEGRAGPELLLECPPLLGRDPPELLRGFLTDPELLVGLTELELLEGRTELELL